MDLYCCRNTCFDRAAGCFSFLCSMMFENITMFCRQPRLSLSLDREFCFERMRWCKSSIHFVSGNFCTKTLRISTAPSACGQSRKLQTSKAFMTRRIGALTDKRRSAARLVARGAELTSIAWSSLKSSFIFFKAAMLASWSSERSPA